VIAAKKALRVNGRILVATFGPEGPEQCSGLDVARYDPDALHGEFGRSFEKIGSSIERHLTPWGTEQEFVFVPNTEGGREVSGILIPAISFMSRLGCRWVFARLMGFSAMISGVQGRLLC